MVVVVLDRAEGEVTERESSFPLIREPAEERVDLRVWRLHFSPREPFGDSEVARGRLDGVPRGAPLRAVRRRPGLEAAKRKWGDPECRVGWVLERERAPHDASVLRDHRPKGLRPGLHVTMLSASALLPSGAQRHETPNATWLGVRPMKRCREHCTEGGVRGLRGQEGFGEVGRQDRELRPQLGRQGLARVRRGHQP